MSSQAACILIYNDRGKVLATSRRGEPTQFGLPGGKIDAEETALEAAVRELFEETGLVVWNADVLEFLYRADDGHGFEVTTFVCTNTIGTTAPQQMESEILVEWVDPKVLIEGPFGSYNAQVFLAEMKRQAEVSYD